MEQIEWASARERFVQTKRQPSIDKEVSKIVGKEIRTTDPRLIKLVVKWKQAENKSDDSTEGSNYLSDPKKLEELKQTLI